MRIVIKIIGIMIGVMSILSVLMLFSAMQNVNIFYQSPVGGIVEAFVGRPDLSFLYVVFFGGAAIGGMMIFVDQIWPPSKAISTGGDTGVIIDGGGGSSIDDDDLYDL